MVCTLGQASGLLHLLKTAVHAIGSRLGPKMWPVVSLLSLTNTRDLEAYRDILG